MTRRRLSTLSVMWCVAIFAGACQENKEPTTTLTQAQWEEVRANILTTPPAKMAHEVGANFGDKVELLGVDISPANPSPGSEVTITWYWKALASMNTNWQVFVHMDHLGESPTRQGMDHHPVRDLYQTTRWKPQEIIKDEQKVRIRGDYPPGEAVFYVGLWNPAGGARLPVSNPADVKHDGDNRVEAMRIPIKGDPKAAKKPTPTRSRVYLARHKSGDITLDGKLDDEAWKRASRATLSGADGKPSKNGTTRAQLLWDETHLYIGMWGQDTDAWGELDSRDADTWTQEVFEVFIDPDGDSANYVELQVTPRNTIFDARFAKKLGRGTGSTREQIDAARAWNASLESAVHVEGTVNDHTDEDEHWSAEIKIPFSDIPGGAPKAGDSWKMNFYRFDAPRDDAGKPQGQVAWAWSPAKGSFHNVQHFGTVRFVGAAGLPGLVRPKAPTVATPKPGAPKLPNEKPASDGNTVKPDKPGETSPPDRPQ